VVLAEGAGLGDNKKQTTQRMSCRSSSKASIGIRKIAFTTTCHARESRPYGCPVTLAVFLLVSLEGLEVKVQVSVSVSVGWGQR
jgi:hypothetical protein